jgi:outer membrane protein OmpA-like peptidoglycan-associated protein
MRTFFFSFLIFLSLIGEAYSQNMVINPGFEETDTISIKRTFENILCLTGWNFKVFDTQSISLGKQTPYGNFRYATKVNNGLNPKSGNMMAEINTLYFTKNQNKHSQSQTFIAGKLEKPLIKNRSYYFEMWYSLNWFGNIASNNIGVWFSDSVTIHNIDRILIKPDLNAECILYTNPAQWKKLSGVFVAKKNANMFVIGNFSNDENTLKVKIENPVQYYNKGEWDKLRETTTISSYFIDEIIVRQEDAKSIKIRFGCEEKFDRIETGQLLQLDNIYFETNKASLLSQSTIQLDELFIALNEKPTLEIEIRGHTDNSGNINFNQVLSENRAKAVFDYLVLKGISAKRLNYIGLGPTEPVVPNNTGANKAKNRRVEIKVIKN